VGTHREEPLFGALPFPDGSLVSGTILRAIVLPQIALGGVDELKGAGRATKDRAVRIVPNTLSHHARFVTAD